jgi:hypothetical protein
MYVKPETTITVFELLIMSGLSLETCEQLRNIGIKNSTTRSHLIGYFYTIFMYYDARIYEHQTAITLSKER